MGRSRRADPDYVLDADRGSSAVATTKEAKLLNAGAHTDRETTREGARDLDSAVEAMPGLTRQQRDRERAMPRNLAGDVPDPRMERTLPADGDIRQPLSSRQRKARSVSKRSAQDHLPLAQYTAMRQLISDDAQWQRTNDALSDNVGDVQQLDDKQRAQVQRIDRAIHAYERANNRGHIVYCNVEMPLWINTSNLDGFARNNFKPGNTVCFDRYTGSAHSLHEIDTDPERASRTAVFEIQTRRGMYLGRSDSLDDTGHLLPRGMRLRVAGTHTAQYRRPDGSSGQRIVIQLVDTDSGSGSEQ